MKLGKLYKYAYVKKPLNKIYKNAREVPEEFYIEWLKDCYDYVRIHSDKEIKEFLALTPEQIMNWLSETVVFVWEAKRREYRQLIGVDSE